MANGTMRKATGTAGPLRTYLDQSAAPLQAAALTLPLLVVYGVGILIAPEAANGADLVSQTLVSLMGQLGPMRWAGYLGFYGLLLVVNLAMIAHLRKTSSFSPRWFWAVLAESAVYAIAVGSLASSITSDLVHFLGARIAVPLSTTSSAGPLAGVIMSAGAGLHEELVFRLAGIAGVARLWLGAQWKSPSLKLLALLLATSLLFSAVHHIVEPFRFTVFVFRTVAGLLFGSLFLLRGFAVAAWTHALYDVWVIVVLGR